MDNPFTIKGKKIVITGGAGFIGSHIADLLLEMGAQVEIIDIKADVDLINIRHIKDKITYHQVSIVETEKIKNIFMGAYAIVHQAALPSVPRSIEQPIETQTTNSTGTLSVFQAALWAGVDRVVYASSSSIYGDSLISPKIETLIPNPISPYAIQKFTNELYGKFYFCHHGLKTIGLRYFNVYGPRQDPNSVYSAVIPKFVTLMKKRNHPQIYGDGSNTRSFTFVGDVAMANLLALQCDTGFGQQYNIASEKSISLNELVSHINSVLNTSIAPEYLPQKKGDIIYSLADTNLAKKILNFEATTSFVDGLKTTIESINI
jgi:UDP-glucose 4-epimerase